MLRMVNVPEGVTGRLLLTGAPGHYGSFEREAEIIHEAGVSLVVCLLGDEELAQKSPAYARAAADHDLPWNWRQFPIPDFGIPEDEEGLLDLARDIAIRLKGGDRVLVHCAAGIGRTGTMTALVLMALGWNRRKAISAVHAAGSHPEAKEQRDLLKRAEIIYGGEG